MKYMYCVAAFILCLAVVAHAGNFIVGTGSADITSEVAEISFMGYAVPNQKGAGVHLRQYARSFVIGDPSTGKRVVFINLDFCMGFQMMKTQVVEELNKLFPGVYTYDNIILSGTHTHSTPGGVSGTVLTDITTFGFNRHSFDMMVEGIVESVKIAHQNARLGNIKINEGDLVGANINRSPFSYLFDPAEERSAYASNTDTLMTLLRFEADEGVKEVGTLAWFAVHCTSMNNTNTLVSSDNKGVAEILFEQTKNSGQLIGFNTTFVAAFAQANEGDVSPNTKGPICIDTGLPCDFQHSTCNGKSETCIASGPGKDMFDSTYIIGNMQFEKALGLYETASEELAGSVDYRHWYVDMTNVTISPEFSSTGNTTKTCQAALGYSFASGTTDGPGDFDFVQSDNSSNPFWNFVSGFLASPTQEQIDCQFPKPILLDVGLTKPMPWVSTVLPLQIVKVGSLYIVAVPGEFSTMSGRRLRNAVYAALKKHGQISPATRVVIAGLSNSYSHYITTFQEYQAQRYEGASTLYGPHTLDAYLQLYTQVAESLATGTPLPAGPTPVDMRNHTFSFITPVIEDSAPFLKNFGDVDVDVQKQYSHGQLVVVSFWGANPRSADRKTMPGLTFLTVEELQANGQWKVVLTDAYWSTKYKWERVSIAESRVTIEVDSSALNVGSTYRIKTYGVSKSLLGTYTPYEGVSSQFSVVA